MSHEGARLSFTAEWIDPAQDYAYKFTLRYYVDDGDVNWCARRRRKRRKRDGFFNFCVRFDLKRETRATD